MVDCKIEWKEYQQLVIEDFRGWRKTWQDYGWKRTEKVSTKFWNSGDNVLWEAEIGIGKKQTDRSKGW